jgi:hypothetical protein
MEGSVIQGRMEVHADHPRRPAPNGRLQLHVSPFSVQSLVELQRKAAEEIPRLRQGAVCIPADAPDPRDGR